MRRLQAEKLASIGMLAAGVAHEINNPAAFVLGNIEALAAQLKAVEDRVQTGVEPVVRRDLRATRVVQTSPARLGQVFLNQIINAAQALTEVDAGRNRIIVRTYDDGS